MHERQEWDQKSSKITLFFKSEFFKSRATLNHFGESLEVIFLISETWKAAVKNNLENTEKITQRTINTETINKINDLSLELSCIWI